MWNDIWVVLKIIMGSTLFIVSIAVLPRILIWIVDKLKKET